MKKYLSMTGKILLYLLIYVGTQFIAGIIIGIYCAIAYSAEVSQTKLIEIINSEIYNGVVLGAIASLIIYVVIFSKKEENLWKRCGFQKTSIKKLIYSILASVGVSIICSCFVCLVQSYFKSYYEVSENISTGMFSILTLISVIVLVPIFEEILFRGLIFNEFRRNINIVVSIILQALIFALAHMNLLQGIYTFVLGSILALVYMWTKSIWSNILMHSTFNLMGVLIMPIILYYTQEFIIGYIVLGTGLMVFALMMLYKDRSTEKLSCNLAENV